MSIVFLTEKPSLLDASCCSVEVVKGAAGFREASLSSISLSTHSPALMDWVTRFASSSFWILTAFPSTLLNSA